MNKETVIAMRALLDSNGKSLTVYADNGYLFNTNTSFVHWDDDNERVVFIKSTNDPYAQAATPIEIITTTYEMIQYMHIQYAIADEGTGIVADLKTLLGASAVTATQEAKIKAFIKEIDPYSIANVYNKEVYGADHPMSH